MQLLTWNQYNYASNLYKILPGHHYILPKPKFNFYIQFNINGAGQRLTGQNNVKERLGFILKSADRPNIQYTQQELNQYNKKRLVTTGIQYGQMSVTFQDTIDEVALKMMKDYTDFYYKDMTLSDTNWKPENTRNRNLTNIFGYNLRGGSSDLYFFDSVEIYEFYNGYYTMYKMINPKIEAVNMGSNDMAASDLNEINMTFRMEGLTYDAIAEPMTAEISRKIGLPFQTGTTGNFRLLQPKTVGSDLGLSKSVTKYQIPSLSGIGNFIGRTIGDIGRNIVGQVLAPTAIGAVSNVLGNAGLGFLTPTATGIISNGASQLSSRIGRLF